MLNINKTIVIILLSLNGSCGNEIAMNCQFDGAECMVCIFIIPGMVKINSVQLWITTSWLQASSSLCKNEMGSQHCQTTSKFPIGWCCSSHTWHTCLLNFAFEVAQSMLPWDNRANSTLLEAKVWLLDQEN